MVIDKYQVFFKTFKVALNNTTFYTPTHPKFISSIQDLKNNIDLILNEDLPLVIKVNQNSLEIEDNVFQDDSFYKELARSLHLKKIQSIIIQKEVTVGHLSEFMINVAANQDDIISRGGMKKILEDKGITTIQIELLDYSKLIARDREQIVESWEYLLSGEQIKTRMHDVEEFSRKVKETVEQFGIKEILEDEGLSKKLFATLTSIKEVNSYAFKEVLLSLGKRILRTRNLSLKAEQRRFFEIFSNFSPEEIKTLMMETFQSKQKIDHASFELFASLISPEVNKKSAELLKDEVKNHAEKINIENLKELLSSLKVDEFTADYLKMLNKDDAEVREKGKFVFDYDHLYENYRFILLDLYAQENNVKRMGIVLERISGQLKHAFLRKSEFFSQFKNIQDEKNLDMNALTSLNEKIQCVWSFAEKEHFFTSDTSQYIYLPEVLNASSLTENDYFDKIFVERRFNELSLRLFFLFFPKEINEFCLRIEAHKKDDAFIKLVTKMLSGIDDSLSLDVLKYIFNFSSLTEKVTLLDAFKGFSMFDKDFLMGVIKCDNFHVRKKGIEVAATFKSLNREIVQALFSSHYYFGFNRNILFEDLEVLEEVYMPEAKPYLINLTKDILFWNKKLRNKARRILEKYNERSC